MGKYESKNAGAVLENVERLLEGIGGQPRGGYRIREVCDELSIFDWWPKYLSAAKLKDMRKFLKAAIERGYTGYVCFKVGAAGCANGMWAHKAESEDGYSPKGECLYKSFTPSYNYWQVRGDEGCWLPETERVEEERDGYVYVSHKGYDSVKTIRQLDALLAAM